MSTRHIETIQNGGEWRISTPGNMFHCYSATKELAFTVKTEGNTYDLPLDRGTGWQAPYREVVIRNDTGAPQTVEVIAIQVPNLPVKGFVDNRELAAQVAVDGGIVTNTSPLMSAGGSIIKAGLSSYNSLFNVGEGGTVLNVTTGAENPNGLYLWSASFLNYTAAGGQSYIRVVPENDYPLVTINNNTTDVMTAPRFLPAGSSIQLFVNSAASLRAVINWEFL